MTTYKENVSGSLFVPRVKVDWGPDGRDFVTESIFYDIRVSLQDQGQNPTGSMKLRPEPKAIELYQTLIEKYRYWSIMITYYYIGGKSISFQFFWGGQSETFGTKQEITVKLVTLLDGLVNANYYASAIADKNEQGISFVDAQKKLLYFFGIEEYPNLIKYTKKASEDCGKAIVKMNYNDGATFNDALQNLVRENGNSVFFNNINSASGIIHTPYTWESDTSEDLPEPGWWTDGRVRPDLRYFYIVGPGMIETFTRTYEWQPPQKSQEITAWANKRAEDLGLKKRRGANPDYARADSATNSVSPSGVYGSKTTEEVRSANNFDGPKKQDIFSKEKEAKISLSVVMCPALTGIKPLDILYIPSMTEDFMEDWIVSSVEYQQDSTGVSISIQGTRIYGLKGSMKPNAGSIARAVAKAERLVGSKDDSSQMWAKFAWRSGVKQTRLDAPKSSPSPTEPPKDTSKMTREERIKDRIEEYNSEYPPLNSNDVFTEIKRGARTTTYKVNDKLFHRDLWINLASGNDVRLTPLGGTTVEIIKVDSDYSLTVANDEGQELQSLVSLYNSWKNSDERELALKEIVTLKIDQEIKLEGSPSTTTKSPNTPTITPPSTRAPTPKPPTTTPATPATPKGTPVSRSGISQQPAELQGSTPSLPIVVENDGKKVEPLDFSSIPWQTASDLATKPSQSPTSAISPITFPDGSGGVQINDPLFAIYKAPSLVREGFIRQGDIYRPVYNGDPVKFTVPSASTNNLTDQLRKEYATTYNTYKSNLYDYVNYVGKSGRK